MPVLQENKHNDENKENKNNNLRFFFHKKYLCIIECKILFYYTIKIKK